MTAGRSNLYSPGVQLNTGRDMPGKRKTMNLSTGVFKDLESEKARMETLVQVPVSWDTFFRRLLSEVVRLRKSVKAR